MMDRRSRDLKDFFVTSEIQDSMIFFRAPHPTIEDVSAASPAPGTVNLPI
jgi:hypothetical protein